MLFSNSLNHLFFVKASLAERIHLFMLLNGQLFVFIERLNELSSTGWGGLKMGI